MGVQYTNRRGDVYYLQTTTGKNGKIRYSCTRKLKGAPVDDLPEGYELREDPDTGQVHLRKSLQTSILPAEKELLTDIMRRKSTVKHFIVDVEESALVIYLADTNGDRMAENLAAHFGMSPSLIRELAAGVTRDSRYTKMMRFVLRGGTRDRVFRCERWCFRGAIDNWFPLMDSSGPLAEVAGRYVGHLGKQSFYDLM